MGTVSPVFAGPYADTLGKCMVSATTGPERATLVRWIVVMMGLHPALQGSGVTPEQRSTASKEVAQLFMRLLTESCKKEATEAIKFEGTSTFESSFGLLGQVAARELFSDPKVSEGMAEFSQFLDKDKLQELGVPQQK